MTESRQKAEALLHQFKENRYLFGPGVLGQLGELVAQVGNKALLVGRFESAWFGVIWEQATTSLKAAGVEIVGECQGAAPNAPYEDVYRIQSHILHKKPDVVVVIDSGSGIDAAKAAVTLASLGDLQPEVGPWFGVGKVTSACERMGRRILPMVPCMLAAGSSAHLTKYSNITDITHNQKKLIIDEAIVPPRAMFDYSLTATAPLSLTLDGAFDGLAHCCEVFFGVPEEQKELAGEICETALDLIISGVRKATQNPQDIEARHDLGLGADLGGYAIMVGGTSGPHLNSFSLVDVMAHGRACALLEPYYTVFFAPAVEDRVRRVGQVYQKHGLIQQDLTSLKGRELGEVVARGMMALSAEVGFPTDLQQVEGMTRTHLQRCLVAAKDPDLASKLQNMPVPLHAEIVDDYMGPVLEAAWSGDLSRIRIMA